MITNILVPTDFSSVANNALQFAIEMAKKSGAKIHLLHIDEIPVTDIYFPVGAYSAYLADIDATTKESFRKLSGDFLRNSGIEFSTSNVMGFGPDEIVLYAKENQIDLIIMGTTGASGLSEIIFGSNAAAVVTRSPVPVLVIPPSAQKHTFKNIVYATDYTETEFPTAARLIYLAQLYDSKVTVLHALNDKDWYLNPEDTFFEKNRKNISFKNWALEEIQDVNVMNAINHYIEETKPDLLVMGKHNRRFFQRIFHRSLSKRMAFHTNIPLLVLNEEKAPAIFGSDTERSQKVETINS